MHPSDKKYEANNGYTANVLEVFDDNNSVISVYDLKPNIYSDQKFSADTLEKLSNADNLKIGIETSLKIFMDGAYYATNLQKRFKFRIQFMLGELMGKKPAAGKMTYYQNFNLDSGYANI